MVATLPGDDAILCQITSQSVHDESALLLGDGDFVRGGLKKPSNIRPNRLFTADRALIIGVAGHISTDAMSKVTETIVRILQA